MHQIENTYRHLAERRMVEIFHLPGDRAYVKGVPKAANFALRLIQRKKRQHMESLSTSSDFFHGPVAEVFRKDLSHISFFGEELNHFCAQSSSSKEETE